jgi:hypothetical protein
MPCTAAAAPQVKLDINSELYSDHTVGGEGKPLCKRARVRRISEALIYKN